MSKYDDYDDYDDDSYEDDDADEVDEDIDPDEDEDSPRSASNPFSGGLPGRSSVSGAGIARPAQGIGGDPRRDDPQRDNPRPADNRPSDGRSGGITTPSPIRSGSGSSPAPFQRPPTGGSGQGGSTSGSGSGGTSSSGGSGSPPPRNPFFSPTGPSGASGSGGTSSSGSGGASSSGGFNRPNQPAAPSGGSGSAGTGSSASSGSGGFNRPNQPSGGSGSSGSSPPSAPRPGFGGSGSGTPAGGSGSSGSGGSGSSSGFNRPNQPASGSGSSGSNPAPGGTSSSGGLGSRNPFGGGSSGSTSSSGGDRRDEPRRDDPRRDEPKKEDKPASGGLGGLAGRLPFGGGDKDKKADNAPRSASGDKPASGGLGGLAGRLPFGGGKKEDDSKNAAPARKDDKPAASASGGGLMGKLGSNLPFGGGAKPADKPASGGSSSSASSAPRPGSSPSSSTQSNTSGGAGASSGAGNALSSAVGGLASRLPFGGGAKKEDKPASSAKPGAKPEAKAETKAVGGIAGRLPFGNRDAGKPAPAKPSPAKPGAAGARGARTTAASATTESFTDRIRGGLKTFFNPEADAKSAKARISKAPKVDQGGMSLDTKLDILGVGLVFAALGILLSSLSSSQGALTGGLTTFLSQLLGKGAIAVPIVMFAAGVYLILRHFGDEAPVIGATRLAGIAMLYVGALAMLQYFDAFSYPAGQGQSFADYLNALQNVLLPLSAEFGRGGGRVGGAIYLFLISNFGEVLGFFLIAGWLIVSLMLSVKLGVAELVMILLSIGRSFTDSLGRRQQVGSIRRAERAEQQAIMTAERAARRAVRIGTARPAEALPAGQPNALPAPIPAGSLSPFAIPQTAAMQSAAGSNAAAPEERTMKLTMRGQTTTFRTGAEGEAASVVTAPPVSVPVPTVAQPMSPAASVSAPAPTKEERGGLFGRIGRNAAPVVGAAVAVASTPPPTGTPAPAKSGIGGLFRRGAGSEAEKPAPVVNAPAVQPQIASPVSTPVAQPAMSAPAPVPAAVVQPERQPAPTMDQPSPYARPQSADTPAVVNDQPARLGDLLRDGVPSPAAPPPPVTQPAPVTAASVQPFQRPPLGASLATPTTTAPTEPPGIIGLTTPVVTSRSSQTAPRIMSAADDIPAPPPVPVRPVVDAEPSILDSMPPPPPMRRASRKDWKVPDLTQLLVAGQDQELDHSVLIARAKVIEETLDSFGAPGRVVEVRTGPVVTQFGVEPDYIIARGKKNRVKVGAIAALDKDLQLALGAKAIRIEAPVPGKGYVGIEVPNAQSSIVRLRDVMESAEFRKITGPLAIALGQGVDGTPVAADLSGMPHLLIAGTTGSGKSVCVNSIIESLILRNNPNKLKFIMVDPKRVELTQYNGIPHLVAPVVTELERIVSVLKWVTREMDERYRRFSAAGSRNLEDFNRHLREGEELMPYIVVIIDELADLMMQAPEETEKTITRIAALARATGIHLVIATQRPSVDVVTGLIKANFPARIAFAVAGGVDSRVILDQPGAERLLGRGDMLYMSGDSPAPVRLQGVFVSDTEINNTTRHWRGQMNEDDLVAASRPLPSAFVDDGRESSGSAWNASVQGRGTPAKENRLGGGATASSAPPQQAFWDREVTGQNAVVQSIRRNEDDDDDDFGDGEDAMFDQAVELVRQMKKASVSLLQRRLRIGYTRAARLIDLMEERGVVGPSNDGSSIPREVIG